MELVWLELSLEKISPRGFKLEQTLQKLKILNRNLLLESWKACQDKKIFIIDGNAYFNRLDPCVVDSLEVLPYCLHPDTFPEFLELYLQSQR